MEDIVSRLSGIDLKLRKLIRDHEQLQQEYSALKLKYNEQNQIVTSQLLKIDELENKISVLRISGNVSLSGKETLKLKQVITAIERDIDKCINLLDR